MSDEQAQKALVEFGRAAMAAMEVIVEALRPLVEAVAEVVRQVYQWTVDRYNEAGAPYGDTYGGMIQWWHKLLEAERLRRQTDMVLERQRFLVELRAQRF